MSELLKIKHIEKDFLIEAGNIYNINIENPEFYYELLNCGKIKENDNNIIIKYDTYNSENLFNKKKK